MVRFRKLLHCAKDTAAPAESREELPPAAGEIYKIYMLLHRSDLNISEIFRQTFFFGRRLFAFLGFFEVFCKIRYF